MTELPSNICAGTGGGRELRPYTYAGLTKSVCAVCRESIDARIVFRDDAVYMVKRCPDHGDQECLLASSVDWYLDAASFVSGRTPPAKVATEKTHGCPRDCGYCPSHQQELYLPVIPITSACNMNCPICYTINRNEDAYRMSRQDMAAVLDRLFEARDDVDIINFTGGEPTLHDELPEFLAMCRERGIRRLTVSTNGLRLTDEEYVKALAAVDARIVLSHHTQDKERDRKMSSRDTVEAKERALELLEKHDVATTLLPSIAKGVNDHEIGNLLNLVLKGRNMKSLELHTLAFTGSGGIEFDREARITIPDLHARIDEATGGKITTRDFVPSPLAHPHCYSICYILCLDGGGYVPLTRILSREKVYRLLARTLYIEPTAEFDEVFREMIDDLWSDPDRVEDSEAVLHTVRRLITELFPTGGPELGADARRGIAERSVKAIYIHSHMDEENFDVSRVMQCCVGVPDDQGGTIPTCAYNVLYRRKDPRFAGRGEEVGS